MPKSKDMEAFPRKNLKRRRSISSDSDKYKAENTHGGVDRLSLLPDDFLISILSLLPLHDAARTSVLSRRFRNIWKQLPVLSFSTRRRNLAKPSPSPSPSPSTIFLPIVSAINNHDPSVPLLRLHLQCRLSSNDIYMRPATFDEVGTIILSLVVKARSLGLRHLTLDCASHIFRQPLYGTIFTFPSLESLSLPPPLPCFVPYVFRMRTTIQLPRLKSLSLNVDYVSGAKLNDFFSKLTSLEELHLQANYHKPFSLSSLTIRHLNLTVCTKNGVMLDLPALESLRLESTIPCTFIPLYNANLPLLKKCVISLKLDDDGTVAPMLCCLSHVEELHLVLIVCLIKKKPYHVLLDPEKDCPVFPNLKYLEVTTCFHELNCKDVITLLHNSPALRSLKLFHKAIDFTKNRVARNRWRSKLPRNSNGNYRYGYFRNLHLEDNKEELLKLLNKRFST